MPSVSEIASRIAGLMTRAGCLAQIHVDDLDAPVPTDDDIHHMARVLRAKRADRIALVDGTGAWRTARWRDEVLLVEGEIATEAPPGFEVTICLSLVKGERTEWAVRKLTELGVDRIELLLGADHGVVRWTADKRAKNLLRLRRIALEASMQSRRTRLPSVEFVDKVTDLATGSVLAQPGGKQLSLSAPRVVIGPEGGWSEAELDAGFALVGLGSTILRAETASVAAGARLCALRESDDTLMSIDPRT